MIITVGDLKKELEKFSNNDSIYVASSNGISEIEEVDSEGTGVFIFIGNQQ